MGEKLFPTFTLNLEVGPYAPVTVGGTGYTYEDAQNSLTIQSPLTVEFYIRREFLGSSNNGSFRIYNLSDATRRAIYHDFFATQQLQAIQFRAGYSGDDQPLIFNGQVSWARSERVGLEFHTIIDAYDNNFAWTNSISSFTAGENTSYSGLFNRLNQDLLGLYPTPLLSNQFPDSLNLRPRVFCGPTMKLVNDLTPPGFTAIIDNSQLKVLAQNDAVSFGDVLYLIESDTGLLSPPIRSQAMIEVNMMFEPRITLGQLVELQSNSSPEFNGQYQVRGITHQGRISPDVDDKRTTQLQLWLGTQALNLVTGQVIQ